MLQKFAGYTKLLNEIKQRIRQGQTRAIFAANAEMISTYWDIGRMLHERQKQEGWGAGVIPRLSKDLHNELPEIKGFSERNIKLMVQFYREYPVMFSIGQLPVAQLEAKGMTVKEQDDTALVQRLVAQLPWTHNVLLMQKIKDIRVRSWYAKTSLEQGWSKDVLLLMIKSCVHERRGKAVSNFSMRLPAPQSDLVQETLKDPYIFLFHNNRLQH